MASRNRADAQLIVHDNYNAVVGPVPRNISKPGANFLLIDNMDAVNSILVSFDAGATYKTIGPLRNLSLDCDSILTYTVKSSAGTVAVETLIGKEN